MTNSAQLSYLMRFHDSFKGVFARDQLPLSERGDHCLIVNTDVSSLSGTHWIAIYVYDKYVYIFDPLGWLPNRYIFSAYSSYNIKYNEHRFQNIISSNCGFHCVYFLYNNKGADNDYVAISFINKFLL